MWTNENRTRYDRNQLRSPSDWDGTLDRIHDALYVKCREAAAREASPTAAIIDSHPSTSSG